MSRPRIDPTESLRNTRRSMGDGTLGGRLRIATPYDPRRLRRATSAITAGNPPAGETVALTGTVTVDGGGTAVIASLDAIQAQQGFRSVSAAGDVPKLPVTATYLAEVDVRWTDGRRDTSVPEVTVNGTAISQVWPDDGHVWGRWVDQVAFAGTRGDIFDVEVTPSDGTSHDAEVTVRLTVLEQLRSVVEATSQPPDAATAWRTVRSAFSTEDGTLTENGGPQDVVMDFGLPASIVEGELLLGWFFADTYNSSDAGTVEPPAGWTEIKNIPDTGGLTSTQAVSICYKHADATDVSNAGGSEAYSFTVHADDVGPFDGDLDFIGYQIVQLDTPAAPTGTLIEMTTTTGISLASHDVGEDLAEGSWGLVLGWVDNNSSAGSRLGYIHSFTGDVTNITQARSGTTNEPVDNGGDYDNTEQEAGVGQISAGGRATMTSEGFTSGTLGVWLAVVPMTGAV